MFIEWTAAQTDKVLNVALDLAKVAFGAIFGAKLAQWQRGRESRFAHKQTLTRLILRIKVQPVTNDIPAELIELRSFFLDEAPELLLRSKRNQEFFRKWPNNPTMSLLASTPGVEGFWTMEKINELRQDLDTIEIPK